MVPMLVYDADCAFCTRSARWISARWRPGVARLVASRDLDDPTLAGFGLDRAAVLEAAWWIDADGRASGGDRAVAAALACAPGWAHHLGRLLGAPGIRALAPAGYRMVARNRHRLPGAADACATP